MSTMPWTGDYIAESLELHLFFARIMKEHAIFLEDGFEHCNLPYIQEVDVFKCSFEEILGETIALANGRVSAAALHSGEMFTPMTLMAEQKTQELTGIAIATPLTVETMHLQPSAALPLGINPSEPELAERLRLLHDKALSCAQALYRFTEQVYLQVVQQCNLYTHNYPSLFKHQMEETQMYICLIQRLLQGTVVDPTYRRVEMEMLWNHLMKEHAEVIRQMLDPAEEVMIEKANLEVKRFKKIIKMFDDGQSPRPNLKQITRASITATKGLRDFKAAGTEAILSCQLRSVIVPLLGDHVLREANHYLRLLGMPLPQFSGGKG